MADLYDDTYHGARWRYGLLHRPITAYLTVRSIPHPILFSHRQSAEYPHGTADWPVELPEAEARHHSLVLVGRVDDRSWELTQDLKTSPF